MKRILISGGTGFVGANLAHRALERGHEVHLLVRPGYRDWRIREIARDLILHEADISDRQALAGVCRKARPEWIFHLTAYGAYSYQSDTDRIVGTNILGTINLLEAAREVGFEAFINTGSSSEYGFKDKAPSEDAFIDPNSFYAVSKASATYYCRQSARQYGLHIPTLRLYSVYGPYEEPTRLMPTLVVKGLSNTYPPLVSAETARDFVYVDDVCDAYFKAAERSPTDEQGPIYNIGTSRQSTIGDVVDIARKHLNITAEPKWGAMKQRCWDTTCWISDNSKARHKLGWEPHTTLEDGLDSLIEWLRNDQSMLEFYRKAIGPPTPTL